MTYEIWLADYDKVHAALEPYVFTDDDGWQGLDTETPQALLRPYSALQQVGYANGWL